jgi:hypothetical protein
MTVSRTSFHLLLFTLLVATSTCFAQVKKISGSVKDKQSDEPIPFAAVFLHKSNQGTLTDSLGKFMFLPDKWFVTDTLEISSVGYKPLLIPMPAKQDSIFIAIKMELLPPQTETVVKSKYNRALWFWRKIMSKKAVNDRARWTNYSYEIYNKLELDLDNVNTNKLGNNKLLKPLNFVLAFVDSTSEEKPFLPVFLTETLSDYFYQKDPKKAYEILKAAKVDGIDNESLVKQLGGMYQNINVYSNYITVFDKQFISPLHDNADKYYNFKLLDTQYLNQKRLVHLRFTPKVKGADIFEGDCWVNDTCFAIQKITLRPSADANINYIGGLSLIQEFKLINDTTWFLYKDKFVADIIPLGKKKLSLKGRKTTTYKNVLLNDTTITIALHKTKKAEQIDVQQNLLNKSDSFWASNRHEGLNKNEQTVYKVLDTLEKNPTFIKYRNILNFITTGTKDIGNITIGPWFYWISGNNYEGTRLRWDLATNKGFNKHLYLHGYAAYGLKDGMWKGKVEARYLLNRNPWTYLHASYRNDFDNGQVYYDQLSTDNLFATWFRRPGIPFKFQRAEETKLEFYKETNTGLAFGLSANSRQFEALENLPTKDYFTAANNGTIFNSFETVLRLRFAYLERTIEDGFYRVTLGSDLPIIDARFTHGWPGVLHSSYQYNKIDISISDYLRLPPYGNLYYNLFAGKVFGTVPYQFLEIQPGNELYYYNKYAFNLMKRFEFITDRFVGFNVEHNIGNGLFRYMQLTRKLKFRQFWSAKGLVGNLSEENKQLNFVGNYPFKSLDNSLYLELGTGVDNIFKLFRIDFVWRVTPNDLGKQEQTSKFGLFGSFRVAF